MIIQRVRDAERDIVYEEYKDRQGEIVNGIVRRFEKGAIVVDLGRAEAVLPPKEQTPRETYRPGDRIRAYVKEIHRVSKGPQIVLSRAAVEMLTKLFAQEVPEIYEGIVTIVSAAREPGARSKIAVASRDSDVDPVGACVGMKGSRVQAVVQELRGERIDIVPWSPDPARYVCSALSPAQVSKVIIDEGAEVDGRDRARRPALAGDRPQGPERAPRGPAHRLAHRHQERVQDARGRALDRRGGVGRARLRRARGGAAAAAGHHVPRGPGALRDGAAVLAAGHRREGRRGDQAAGGRARDGEGGGGGPGGRGGRRRGRRGGAAAAAGEGSGPGHE